MSASRLNRDQDATRHKRLVNILDHQMFVVCMMKGIIDHGGIEFAFVRARDLRDEIQVAFGDGESVRQLIEGNRGRCFQPAGGHTGVAQLRGKRHRKAARVRGGQKFFRICPYAVFKARAEGVLRLLQNATIGRNGPFPVFQTALPYRRCFALHAFSPFGFFVRFESREFDSRANWKGIFRKWACRESFVNAHECDLTGRRAPAMAAACRTVGDGADLA